MTGVDYFSEIMILSYSEWEKIHMCLSIFCFHIIMKKFNERADNY